MEIFRQYYAPRPGHLDADTFKLVPTLRTDAAVGTAPANREAMFFGLIPRDRPRPPLVVAQLTGAGNGSSGSSRSACG